MKLFAIIVMVGAALHAHTKGLYPDPKLTPGQVNEKLTAEVACKPGYSATVRSVPESVHKEVFKRYGIDWKDHSKYEVDHFVSLELGGTNDLSNLWPQPYADVEFTARQKDQAEDWLHREVCKHQSLTLHAAQQLIMKDWVGVYKSCCLGKGL